MRIALPKGHLFNAVTGYCGDAGLSFAFDSDRSYSPAVKWDDELTPHAPHVEAKLIKPKAVPGMVGRGNFQVGFCGKDVLQEFSSDHVIPLMDLGLGGIRLVAAVSRERKNPLTYSLQRPLVIATEFERLSVSWALKLGLNFSILQTFGTTEAYVPDDADIAVDCVESGKTMEDNNLVVIDTIMTSTVWFVANEQAYNDPTWRGEIDFLTMLLQRKRGGNS